MALAALSRFAGALSPGRLTGPIFEKELRVSSRRRRSYMLRVGYLVALTCFLTVYYFIEVEGAGMTASTYEVSRLSEIGKGVCAAIVWFQFCAAQLLALVLCSTAISDEVYHGTLGVLMSTPLSSFQIVAGKLVSRVLQISILLLISLPLLALVRIFGGVPWNYVLASLCITLTAVLLAGAASLYYSARNRKAHVVIFKTVLAGAVVYGALSMAGGVAGMCCMSVPGILSLAANPMIALGFLTKEMMSPSAGTAWVALWPVHCALMLGLTVAVLFLTARRVRRVGREQWGGPAVPVYLPPPPRPQVLSPILLDAEPVTVMPRGGPLASPPPVAAVPAELVAAVRQTGALPGTIRPVTGSPIVWKDMLAPRLAGQGRVVGLIVLGAVLAVTYLTAGLSGGLEEAGSHVTYACVFMIMGALIVTVMSATSITAEKEAHCWPILLTCPMGDWEILRAKAVAVFRRSAAGWVLLFGHLLVFTLVGYVHPITVLLLGVVAGYMTALLLALGLYFSTVLKRTTTAVSAALAVPLVLWLIAPLLGGLLLEDFGASRRVAAVIGRINPVIQTIVVTQGSAGEFNVDRGLARQDYDWWSEDYRDRSGWVSAVEVVGLSALGYGLAAAGLLAAAARAVRRKAFA